MRNLFLLLIVVTLIGCDFVETEPVRKRRSRGSLSGAAEKASDDYSEERIVKEKYVVDHVIDCNTASIMTYSDTSSVKSIEKAEAIYIKPYYTSGVINLRSGTDIMQFGLDIGGTYSENKSIGCDLGIGQLSLLSGHKLSKGFKKDMLLMNASLKYSKAYTPEYTFLGAHYTIGIGPSLLYYKFRNSIYDDDGDKISSDFVTGVNIFFGLGGLVFNPENIKITADFVGGIHLWNDTTFQDFENDVFKPSPYILFKLGLQFENY